MEGGWAKEPAGADRGSGVTGAGSGDGEALVVRLHETEKALYEKEQLLRLALRQAPVTLWQQDEQLRYRWIYNSKMGFQDKDVVGRRDVDLLEDREQAERLEELKRSALASGCGRRDEVAVSRDGQTHFYDLIIEPIFEETGERASGIICAAIEITVRKEGEAVSYTHLTLPTKRIV